MAQPCLTGEVVHGPNLEEPGRWPDLVFHVLAHVTGTAGLAASIADAEYVGWAEQRLGPVAARLLGEDARLLARALPTHELLGQAQLLAWLFESVEQAQRHVESDLAELRPDDVADARALEQLAHLGPEAELLRCAVELEEPHHGALPAEHVAAEPLRRELERMVIVAPALVGCSVGFVRALRLHGRVRGTRIWVGLPGAAVGPPLEHVLWQACHEATVHELEVAAQRSAGCGDDAGTNPRVIEQAAVVLLAARARRAGEGAAHGRWLAHFGGNAPGTEPASLGPAERRLVEQALAG